MNLEQLPQALVEADKKDWGSIYALPAISEMNGNPYITVDVHAGDTTVKAYINKMIKDFGFKTKFDCKYSEGDTHCYNWFITKISK